MAGKEPEVKIRMVVENGRAKAVLNETKKEFKSFTQEISKGASTSVESLDLLNSKLDTIGNSLEGLKKFGAGLIAFSALKGFANSLMDVSKEMQQVKNTFEVAAGSAGAGAMEYKYVSGLANELGLNLQQTANQYAGFAISAKTANLTAKESHDIFTSASQAVTVFGLDSIKTAQAFRALEQMLGAGVVRSQDLKLQLDQAIPGAFENFRDIVTKFEKDHGNLGFNFQKALEKGLLDVKKYAPQLAQALNTMITPETLKGAAEDMTSEFKRLENAVYQFKQALAGEEFQSAAASVIRATTTMVSGFQGLATTVGPMAVTWGLGTGAVLAMGAALNKASASVQDTIKGLDLKLGLTKETRAATLEAAEASVIQTKAELAQAAVQAQQLQTSKVQMAQQVAASALNIKNAEAELARMTAVGASNAAMVKGQEALNVAKTQYLTLQAETFALDAKEITTQTALTAAQSRHTAAVAASGAASAAASKGVSVLTLATTGLKGAVSGIFTLLGGLPGLLLAVAGGVYYLATAETELEEKTKDLGDAIKKMQDAQGAEMGAAAKQAGEVITKTEKLLEYEKVRLANLKGQRNMIEEESTLLGRITGLDQARMFYLWDQEVVGEKILKQKREELAIAEREKELLEIKDAIYQREQQAISDIGALRGKLSTLQKEYAEGEKKIKNKSGTKSGALELDKVDDLKELDRAYKALQDGIRGVGGPEVHAKLTQAAKDYNDLKKSMTDQYTASIKQARNLEYREFVKKNAKEMKESTGIYKEAEKALESFADQEEKLNAQRAKVDPIEQRLLETKKTLRDRLEAVTLAILDSNLAGEAQAEILKKLEAGYKKVVKAAEDAAGAEFIKRETEGYRATEAVHGRYETQLMGEAGQEQVALIEQRAAAFKELEDAMRSRGFKEGSDEWVAGLTRISKTMDKLEAKAKETSNVLMGFASQVGTQLQGFIQNSIVQVLTLDPEELRDRARAEFEQRMSRAGLSDATERYQQARDDLAEQDLNRTSQAYREQEAQLQRLERASHEYQAASIEMRRSFDPLQEKFKEIGEAFTAMIDKMVADMASEALMQGIRMLISAGVNGASSTMSSLDNASFGAATGGYIAGPGTSTSDSIPAMLSNGEFVVQAEAVRKYGSGFLERINQMRLGPDMPVRRFAEGGAAGAVPEGGMGSAQVNVINNTGQEARTERKTGPDGRELIEIIIGRVAGDIQNNGPVAQSIQRSYGVTRGGRSRG